MACIGFMALTPTRADVAITAAVQRGTAMNAEFKVGDVPPPSRSDAANQAKFRTISGSRDSNSAGVECLNDGAWPTSADEPQANFFFAAGRSGGRVLVDLGQVISVRQVNTYSWHPTTRGPQVYQLFTAGEAESFDARRARRGEPTTTGWTLLATVDTRDANQAPGGQYAVCITDDADGVLADARYLLFVIDCTESDDPFGNTFYSEIDVVDGREHSAAPQPAAAPLDVLDLADGYQIEFDASEVPDLKPWIDETLKPVCAAWYPKIAAMLPSEDFEAPRRFRISFRRNMRGVAHCAGTRIECAGQWFLTNRDGEAAGAVVHEMVHVVQQYGRARRGRRNPGWLVEGLADYIRWFLYEPENLRPRVDPQRAKYTDSYRTTGAFLDYVVREHDDDLIAKLNAAMRRGEFDEDLWKECTGHTVDDLWEKYIATLEAPSP
jgi:hypothetical protein